MGVLERELPASERLEMLHESMFDNPPKLEVAVRAWSFQNPFIERSVDKMDKKRVTMLTQVYQEMGLEPDQAKVTAEIEYSTFLGVQTYCMNRSKHSARRIFMAFQSALSPAKT
jgi:hypothetical protein